MVETKSKAEMLIDIVTALANRENGQIDLNEANKQIREMDAYLNT
jgi:hypothetical protein